MSEQRLKQAYSWTRRREEKKRRMGAVMRWLSGPVLPTDKIVEALESLVVVGDRIEQESGIEEFDASDRALIWAIHGGEQRVGMGLADVLVEDSIDEIASAVRRYVLAGKPAQHRSEQVSLYSERIAAIDASKQVDPLALREQWSVLESKGGAR